MAQRESIIMYVCAVQLMVDGGYQHSSIAASSVERAAAIILGLCLFLCLSTTGGECVFGFVWIVYLVIGYLWLRLRVNEYYDGE